MVVTLAVVAGMSGAATAAPSTGSTPPQPSATADPRIKVKPNESFLGPFLIYNSVTNRCMDIPGFGPGTLNGPVNQYPCNGSSTADNQLFYLVQQTGGNYLIENYTDLYCLDLPGTGTPVAGDLISEYTCNPSQTADNQLFFIEQRQASTFSVVAEEFWLVNFRSNLCIDVAGTHAGNNARLEVRPCSDTDDHHWVVLATS